MIKEPCIVARELMEDALFVRSLGIDQTSGDAYYAATHAGEQYGRKQVQAYVTACVRRAIERAIEEDRRTR